MKLRPLLDRVVVRRIAEVAVTPGGILIPDNNKEKPAEGIVLAVGSGKIENGIKVPLDVKPGDHILFGKYSGADVEVNHETLLILREEDIFAAKEDFEESSEEMPTFLNEDKVQLKSGGPVMTVVSHSGDEVTAEWVNEENEIDSSIFLKTSLKLVS